MRQLLHKRIGKWQTATTIFLACLFLLLSIRASDEFRWSDWGFGDAQSMLSLRHWEEEGWFSNYFLFIPQGYARAVRLFDEPGLRQHAHGTCPGSSPRVGPKLWYTHYPAGYLIPYAILFRIGLDDAFHARMLSLIFSICALILMYVLFSKIAGHGASFIAVLFYGLSPPFLGFADTIANQPIDDLLRFAFMLAVVFSTRATSPDQRKRWMISAWVFEFMLSSVSFDSVFFIYVWLVAWDIMERRGFRWKTYLIYGMAPLTAHTLQFLQNVWYLGLDDTIIDIKDAFLLKNAADVTYNVGQDRLSIIRGTVPILFNNLYTPAIFIVILGGLYTIYTWFLKDRGSKELPSLRLLAVLFLCGIAFALILPHGARMPYEARQMLPFVALLAGGVTWSFVKEFKYSIHGNPGNQEEGSLPRKGFRFLYLLLSSVLLISFWYLFILDDRTPVYYIPDQKTDGILAGRIETMKRYDLMRFRHLRFESLFAKELKKMPTAFEPIFFSIEGFSLYWDPTYVPGYPQIMPLIEYYIGSKPILCFNYPEGLADDLLYLLRRSPYKFSPVLVSGDEKKIDYILEILLKEGLLLNMPYKNVVMGKYVVDLTGSLTIR
ncbi:MAG: glycosyltransferase family 39 protein [Nitrospirae bacterium]|nr:glycosyltransferase family 39 protein [Nitrospirota bacterium]